MKKLILFIVLTVIVLIIYSMLSEKTIHDIDGGFEQTAYVRNENNTGPVVRLYAFTVRDTLWENIKMHGDLLPHTKYGTTEAYYFLQENGAPATINLGKIPFDEQYESGCIAKFSKDGQGRAVLLKYPFRN